MDYDMILDPMHSPTFDEIEHYMNPAGYDLWKDIHSFIKERYQAAPKFTYSKCSQKPGWNVKYQKSGKSLCTLYPEKDGFVGLVVITLNLLPVIEEIEHEFSKTIRSLIKTAKPFNGTLWLMVPVYGPVELEDIKQLLILKHNH